MGNLILRSSISPYGDTTKGSVLSNTELDGNFIDLKGEVIYSAESGSGSVTLKKYNGNDITFDVGSSSGSTSEYWSSGSTGLSSIKADNGSGLDATGNYALAEGYATLASGQYSHAEGNITTSVGNASHAEGFSGASIGFAAHSEGYQTIASGASSHAEGYLTTSSAAYSHAEGRQTTAFGANSHAEGQSTIASGTTSHAEGFGSNALNTYAHAEGFGTAASGSASHSEGYQTIASAQGAHAEGRQTTASGLQSHAEGYLTTASGDFSHAEGGETLASGEASHAEGLFTTASGESSHAEGDTTIASGDFSHAEGNGTIASGLASHAEGDMTIASGIASHAEGTENTASGDYSHAEGNSTIASNQSAHAEGNSTTASGDASHAEGNSTIASGDNSHAEGYSNTASGESSHAEGSGNVASGQYSHAENAVTTALGAYSHAGGFSSIASGTTSFVHGSGSTAGGIGTVVLGNDIIGLTDNTTYVPNLNISLLSSGTSVNTLGIDTNGFVVTADTANISDALYTVNYGLNASGTTISTGSICIYGVNVFTGVTGSNYATKLPQPVTGKSVKIINLSNNILYVYPSNVGGTINNLPVDTPAQIPPDGKLYEFVCVVNPLPGAWVWSAPATSQYDSGEIILPTITASGTSASLQQGFVLADSNNYGKILNIFSTTAWAYDGKSNPLVQQYVDPNGYTALAFKPVTPWLGITKIKVYTNLANCSISGTTGASAGYVTGAWGQNYYTTGSSPTFVTCTNFVATSYFDAFPINLKLGGTPTVSGNTVQSNIGDAGTYYCDENLNIAYNNIPSSVIGDKYIGQVLYLGSYVDVWETFYLSVQIKPLSGQDWSELSGVKMRFFIEYF